MRDEARMEAFADDAVARRPANVSNPTPTAASPMLSNAISATSRTGVALSPRTS
jgi:hypothetical protein